MNAAGGGVTAGELIALPLLVRQERSPTVLCGRPRAYHLGDGDVARDVIRPAQQ